MRPKRAGILVACLASIAPLLASCGGAGPSADASASGASEATTIHVILHPGNDTYVPGGSLTGCAAGAPCRGDYLIGNDPLYDADTRQLVGTLAYVEFAVNDGDSLFHSPGNTITLDGRGQIVFSETLYDDGSGRPATGIILGGTGEFLGAKGYIISRSLNGRGDFVITIVP